MKESVTNYLIKSKSYPKVLLPAICILIFFSMGCNKKNTRQELHSVTNNSSTIPHQFPMVTIPEELKNPSKRAEYLISHYWDNFDFSDTSYISLPMVTEQAFADYVNLFDHTDIDEVTIATEKMLNYSSEADKTKHMYNYFLDLYKKYLYDPNSPVRNDEYYIPIVKYILADTISDETSKERAKFALSMMMKNRKGESASNFKFVTPDQKISSLNKLSKVYTLLYFYNPECHACKETLHFLKNSSIISGLISSNKLDILAIYPDQDISLWQQSVSEVPQKWINGFDKDGVVKKLYDLRAIPTLYLLDSQKKVLLKDVNTQTLEDYFSGYH